MRTWVCVAVATVAALAVGVIGGTSAIANRPEGVFSARPAAPPAPTVQPADPQQPPIQPEDQQYPPKGISIQPRWSSPPPLETLPRNEDYVEPSYGEDWPRDCLVAERTMVSMRPNGDLWLCGTINAEAVREIMLTLSQRTTRLRIRSLGGELDAPLDLSELIRNRDWEVIVDGPCLSACASFVFVASRHRIVTNRGVLGMHNTSTSVVDILDRQGLRQQFLPPNSVLEQRARRERALYESRKVGLLLLSDPQKRIETVCLMPTTNNRITNEERFEIVSRADFWAPTRQQWREFGVSFEGPMTDNVDEASDRLNSALPRNRQNRLRVIIDPRQIVPASQTLDMVEVASCSVLNPDPAQQRPMPPPPLRPMPNAVFPEEPFLRDTQPAQPNEDDNAAWGVRPSNQNQSQGPNQGRGPSGSIGSPRR